MYAPLAQETVTEEPGSVALTPAQQAAERQLDPSSSYFEATSNPEFPFSCSCSIDGVAYRAGSEASDSNSNNYKQASAKGRQGAFEPGEEARHSNAINNRLLFTFIQISVLNRNSTRINV